MDLVYNIENKSDIDLKRFNLLLKDLMRFFQEKLNFDIPFKLSFLSDIKNSRNPLGKTAYYDIQRKIINVYVDDRHIKDVLRSISHEMIHHNQNCNGQLKFKKMFNGYMQKDEDLRNLEKNAFELGNTLFRDWEASIKDRIKQGFPHAKKKANNLLNDSKSEKNLRKMVRKIASEYKDADYKTKEQERENLENEGSTTANISGYSLPLGMTNWYDPEKKVRPKGYKRYKT